MLGALPPQVYDRSWIRWNIKALLPLNCRMILLAVLLPWLSFLLRGKIISGLLCLLLQITLIGWLPAAIWAVVSLSDSRAERRNRRLIRAVRNG